MSAIQERIPELPSVSPDDMAALQTLQSIVDVFNVAEVCFNEVKPQQAVSGLSAILLEVVADKTGYPAEMLNLEMHLDSDLGIDSIKRVEILSALQDKMPNLPVVAADDLAALQTLQQIIEYMIEQMADSISAHAPEANIVTKAREVEKESRLIRSVVRINKIEEADQRNAIAFNKDKEIWITKEGGQLAEQLAENYKC